jgi:hypothetical protein
MIKSYNKSETKKGNQLLDSPPSHLIIIKLSLNIINIISEDHSFINTMNLHSYSLYFA